MGVTDYRALYFRLAPSPSHIEMTISDLQLIMNVTMWTAEPEGEHRSEVVFAEILHGAQASVAIPTSEDGLAHAEGGLGYKWSVPDGDRLLELSGLARPTAWNDRLVSLKQLECEAIQSDSRDHFKMRPPGQLPARAGPEYDAERVGKRTWVLSLSAFRPSDQKTVRLMREAALNLNYDGDNGDMLEGNDSMVRFLSWEHTALKAVTASHQRAHRRVFSSSSGVVAVVVVASVPYSYYYVPLRATTSPTTTSTLTTTTPLLRVLACALLLASATAPPFLSITSAV